MKLRLIFPITLLGALLLLQILFLAYAQKAPSAELSDSKEYLNASKNLYNCGVLYTGDLSQSITEELYTRRPPLYPLLLGLVILSDSRFPLFIVQMLFSLLSVFLIYTTFIRTKFFQKSSVEKQSEPASNSNYWYLILPFLFILSTPAQFIYTNLVMAEILFQLLLVLMTWCLFQYGQRRGKPLKSFLSDRIDSGSELWKEESSLRGKRGAKMYIWLFFLFLTMGMATKPVLFPFGLVLLPLSVLLFLRTRERAFLTAMLIPLLWIGLYGLWNYNRTGSIQYSSIQTANMVNYNLRYYIMEQEGPAKAAEKIDEIYATCGNEEDYRSKIRCLNDKTKESIFDQPFSYALFHLKGVLGYFLDPGRFDLATFFNLESKSSAGFLTIINDEGLAGAIKTFRLQGWGIMMLLLIIALFKLLKLSGFLIYLFRRNEQFQMRIFLFILVGYLAIVTGPLGASRFLLPVELILIATATRGWAPILQRFTSKGKNGHK
jgi:hypothetical protein